MDYKKIDISNYLYDIGKEKICDFLLDKFDKFDLYIDYYYLNVEYQIFFETIDS